MRKSRYTEEQIIAILKEAERGKVTEVIRRHGIAQKTYYNWKAKYGGLDVNEAHRFKALEEENRRLKKLVADQALDISLLKELLGKGLVTVHMARMSASIGRVAGTMRGGPRPGIYPTRLAGPRAHDHARHAARSCPIRMQASGQVWTILVR